MFGAALLLAAIFGSQSCLTGCVESLAVDNLKLIQNLQKNTGGTGCFSGALSFHSEVVMSGGWVVSLYLLIG